MFCNYLQCPVLFRFQTISPHTWPQRSNKSQHQRSWWSVRGCRHNSVEHQPLDSSHIHHHCFHEYKLNWDENNLIGLWTRTHCVHLDRISSQSRRGRNTAESPSLLVGLDQMKGLGQQRYQMLDLENKNASINGVWCYHDDYILKEYENICCILSTFNFQQCSFQKCHRKCAFSFHTVVKSWITSLCFTNMQDKSSRLLFCCNARSFIHTIIIKVVCSSQKFRPFSRNNPDPK